MGLCARQAVCLLRTRECRPKATRHRAPRTQSRSAHCRDSAVGRRALVFVNVVQGNAPSHASRSVVAALRQVPAAASPCARAHVSIAHKRRATTSCAHKCSHHVASLCARERRPEVTRHYELQTRWQSFRRRVSAAFALCPLGIWQPPCGKPLLPPRNYVRDVRCRSSLSPFAPSLLYHGAVRLSARGHRPGVAPHRELRIQSKPSHSRTFTAVALCA